MVVVNDPYLSGTHLNDVTVIRAIHHGGRLVGFAANKAHHTDVGGAVPGSMPPDARDLFAEGAVYVPTLLMRDDRVVEATVDLLRANSRTPEARAGDLRAQIAGNVVGERRFLELIERYGIDVVDAALDKALDDGERRTRAALRALPDGVVEHDDVMEDERGEPTIVLRLRLEKRGETIALDYTGTAAQRAMPLNAVYGVTLSGAYYALRAVTDPRIPMNDGSFRPVDVHVPEGTLLNPRRPAPVSGGNVETSMRNADLVLGALREARAGTRPRAERRLDEQRDDRRARRRGTLVGVLRDERLRDGRAARRRRDRRHPRPHDEHVEHADRSDRTDDAAADHRLRVRRAERRRRPLSRRLRARARVRAARRHRDGVADGGAACGAAARNRGRRATARAARTSSSRERARSAIFPRRRRWRCSPAMRSSCAPRAAAATAIRKSAIPRRARATAPTGSRTPNEPRRVRGTLAVTAAEVRAAVRAGTLAGPTERLAAENVQANLVVVPARVR